MGYYSDVAIVMREKDYNQMIRRAKALKNSNVMDLIESAKCYKDGYNRKRRILKWESVKWYEEYSEVRWICKFIENIDCIFIRIGEDLEDTVYDMFGDPYSYDLYDSAHIERSIGLEDVVELKGPEERYSRIFKGAD